MPELELVEAGPAPASPARPPTPPAASDTPEAGSASTSPTDAAAERKAARRAREAAKKAAADKRRAAAAARKAKKGVAEPAELDEGDDDEPGELVNRTDTDRQRDAAAFLGVAYRLVGLVVGLLGGEWKPAQAAAKEDAAVLVPVMNRSPGFDRFVSVVAAPFVIVERIAASVHRKPKELRA